MKTIDKPWCRIHYREDTHDKLIIDQAENYFATYDVGPGDVFIDIGAHIGAVTMIAAHKGATVHAYEPEPENYELLTQNTKHLPNVYRYPLAVAGVTGRRSLFKWQKSKGNTGSYSMCYGEGVAPELDVGCVSLETVIALADYRCNLLKVDCEGGEYSIFYDASDVALSDIERIVMEWHRTPEQGAALRDYLVNKGFICDHWSMSHEERVLGGLRYAYGKMLLRRG